MCVNIMIVGLTCSSVFHCLTIILPLPKSPKTNHYITLQLLSFIVYIFLEHAVVRHSTCGLPRVAIK